MKAPGSTVAVDRVQGNQETKRPDHAVPSPALQAAQRIAAAQGWALHAAGSEFALYGPRGRVVRRESIEAAVRFVEVPR